MFRVDDKVYAVQLQILNARHGCTSTPQSPLSSWGDVNFRSGKSPANYTFKYAFLPIGSQLWTPIGRLRIRIGIWD